MLHTKNGIFLILVILLVQVGLEAQSDSTLLLIPDKLGIADIHITKEAIAQNKIYTASRTLNNIEELPYSVYVITGEEILEKGLFTLVDVLKLAPGIFVSQPGSALHGETFIMNGLYGNTHAKIMVDNIPVRPYGASGTPIAQQLPIRQAERIEITYGPSVLSNGSEAGAGTINIVTRKSKRPVFVYSDLAVGSQGYNSMNVLFGGKLGKKKNTLNFNAYGTTTFLNTINLATIAPHYDPESYPLNSFSILQDTFLNIGELPLTSRQLSINLNFRSFHLTLSQMQRSSHSAIGSSPSAIKYNNPTTTYGETINLITFVYQKDLKKVGFKFQSDVAILNVNEESSFEYNFPYAKLQLDRIIDANSNGNIVLRDSTIGRTDESYFEERRFASGSSLGSKISGNVSIFPTKNIELLLSPNIEVLSDSRFDNYNVRPTSNRSLSDGGRFQLNINLIARAYIKFEKVNLILGVNRFTNVTYLTDPDSVINGGKLLPQLAGMYKINSNLSLKANYSNSYLIPSNYWNNQGGEIPKNALVQELRENDVFQQSPQETKYGELALLWKLNKMVKVDLAFFAAQNRNLLSFTQRESEDTFLFGYDNSDGRSSNISGLRLSLSAKDIFKKINIGANFNCNQGKQDLPSGETLDGLLQQPKYIAQFNITFNPNEKLSISIDNTFVGKYSSSNLQSISEYNNEIRSINKRDATYSLNIAASSYLNDNFKVFIKGSNFTSFFLPGIDASGSPNDLSLNTQRYSYLITGVSYNLD